MPSTNAADVVEQNSSDAASGRAESHSLTHRGQRNESNGDRYLVSRRHDIFAIADGIGSVAKGEETADRCLTYLEKNLSEALDNMSSNSGFEASNAGNGSMPHPEVAASFFPSAIKKALQATNGQLLSGLRNYDASMKKRGGCCVAGIVLATGEHPAAHVLHAGDVRVYGGAPSGLSALTVDHAKTTGATGASSGRGKGRVTRALGVRPTVEITQRIVSLADYDFFLICSDGVFNCLGEANLNALFGNGASSSKEQFDSFAAELERCAPDDDATAIVVVPRAVF